MKQKILFLLAIALVISGFIFFDLSQYFSLDSLKAHQRTLTDYHIAHPEITVLCFFAAYVVIAAFSLPGAAIMTLAAGLLFGLVWGVVIVSFASSIGATLAFFSARWLLRNSIEERFGSYILTVNEGVKKDGAFYLFTMRLVPVVPFFVINLVMGLTKIRAFTFYAVSQLGMLPGTIVYVNAGTQLSAIEKLSDILSFNVLFAFVLLGVFPLLAKKGLEWIRGRQSNKP